MELYTDVRVGQARWNQLLYLSKIENSTLFFEKWPFFAINSLFQESTLPFLDTIRFFKERTKRDSKLAFCFRLISFIENKLICLSCVYKMHFIQILWLQEICFVQGRTGWSGNSGGCPKGRLPEEKKVCESMETFAFLSISAH